MDGYRILVVEDDAESRHGLQRLLSHKGWVVTVARTVAEAMEKLRPPPHCLLLDLMLPDGEGEDVLRKVKKEGLPTRVAICTGTNDPVRLAMIKGMDPERLFAKPVDFEEVCRMIEDDTLA